MAAVGGLRGDFTEDFRLTYLRNILVLRVRESHSAT